jgi:hypothetical protein
VLFRGHRDLAKDKLPHLDDGTVKAISSEDPAEVRAHKESARLSDQLTDELLASVGSLGHFNPDVELRDSIVAQGMD